MSYGCSITGALKLGPSISGTRAIVQTSLVHSRELNIG